MYRISKQLWFCAAHQVRLSETRCEALHGHNYRVVVHAEARELDPISYVVDFAALKSAAVQVAGRFDHQNINEVEPFTQGGRNPTAEELYPGDPESAQALCNLSGGSSALVSLGRRFPLGDVCKVEVFETDNTRAEYCP